MSISGLGVYLSPSVGSMPVAENQAKAAVIQSGVESTISDYGKIQNSLSTLQSRLQNLFAAPAAADAVTKAPEAQGSVLEAPAGSSEMLIAARAVVDSFNLSQMAAVKSQLAQALSAISPAELSIVGISFSPNGLISLDGQVLGSAVSSNPSGVSRVFSSILQQMMAQPLPAGASPLQGSTSFASQASPAAQYRLVSEFG